MSAPEPLLDVVICTYNNAEMLDTVLVALARQTKLEDERWSCLVVDNNCTDNTQAVIERHLRLGTIPGLRAIRESEQGLTPARLRGVCSSTASWVAFVDDDCLLEPDWIANALAFASTHPSAGAFGGKVILDFVIKPPPYVRTYAYAFAAQDHGESSRTVGFLAGAGLVVNRSALRACGWTDAPLLADRVGTSLVSGGDVEIVLRVAGAGYALWYVPECRLRHRVPTRRTSLRYLIAINWALGVSQALADALVFEGSAARWLLTSGRRLIAHFMTVARVAGSAALGRKRSADFLIQASFRLGQLAGIARIVTMTAAQRRGLLGLARAGSRRDAAQPTRAA